MNNYHFLLILIVVFVSYFFSQHLVKIKKISLLDHRRLWNIILLISFLVSGILGLILAMFIDLKLTTSWYRPLLWHHVEFGIVMSLVGIFHTLWHFPYYLSIFKKK